MCTKLAPFALSVVFQLTASGGCTPDDGGTSRATSTVSSDPPATVVIASEVGAMLTKQIAVSGRDRLEVPSTRDWSCGRPLQATTVSNVAWVELANPSADTVSVSAELDGLTATHPKLFVYGTRSVPLRDCLTLARERKLTGPASVVIEPSSSAYVLVSAGAATGVYTLAIRTEHVIAN